MSDTNTYICMSGLPGVAQVQQPPTAGDRYVSHPAWLKGDASDYQSRKFESAETNRLNRAHWQYADEKPVNVWLAAQLATIRSRATYEARNNAIFQGIIHTHAEDIVGRDGPSLQVHSDNEKYNSALENLWKLWFAAPTPRRNVSGTAILKLWIRSLWRSGEFLCQIVTDSTAEGPVKMRLRPVHPRRLGTPLEMSADPSVVMGIRFDSEGRPATYYIADSSVGGNNLAVSLSSTPYPADLIVHEFILDEEDQARGIPFANPTLQTSADLRDYNVQVQDAARQMADQACLLKTNHPDAELWTNPESVTVKRRTIGMCPPGWEPFIYPATQPPATYGEYLGERMRELGRPVGMPLLMVRLDASKHNYSSARLDTQVYRRSIAGLQTWISGSDRSYGTLSRLVDELAREARFTVLELRERPDRVSYVWTWPVMPHVDPAKESKAEGETLTNITETLTDAVAARGRDLETHIATIARERQLLEEAGIAPPPWMGGGTATETDDDDAIEDVVEEAVEDATP